MKKLFGSLVVTLMCATPAFAAVTDFQQVSIDVPEGWQSQDQGQAVALMPVEMDTVLMVVMAPMAGTSAEEVATMTAAQMNAPAPVKDGDGYLLKANMEGQDALMFVRAENGKILIITASGAQMEKALTVGKTAKVK